MASNASHRQTLARVLRSPLVLVPAIAGAGATAVALLMGRANGLLSFVGVAGLLFAVGSAATQLLLSKEKGADSDWEGSMEAARKKHERYLTDLLHRLRRDRDDRTEEILDRLHRLNDRLHMDGLLDSDLGGALAPEIRERVKELYWSCLKSLERSWEYWRAAMEMSTSQVRQEMLDRREKVLQEVQDGTTHLETTVDHLRAKQLEDALDETELTRVRQELDVGLTAARRVEEQMRELETRLAAGPEKE